MDLIMTGKIWGFCHISRGRSEGYRLRQVADLTVLRFEITLTDYRHGRVMTESKLFLINMKQRMHGFVSYKLSGSLNSSVIGRITHWWTKLNMR